MLQEFIDNFKAGFVPCLKWAAAWSVAILFLYLSRTYEIVAYFGVACLVVLIITMIGWGVRMDKRRRDL